MAQLRSRLRNSLVTGGCVFVTACLGLALVSTREIARAQDAAVLLADRLARLEASNDRATWDPEATNRVLTTAWPSTLRPRAANALEAAIKLGGPKVELDANSIYYFVAANGTAPPALLKYIEATLLHHDPPKRLKLLQAACKLGPQAGNLRDAVRSQLNHHDPIVAINAAAALCRISPDDPWAHRVLRINLGNSNAAMAWRAADAIYRGQVSDADMVAKLRSLLKHDDVRVRITAAFALWKITQETETTLPVLLGGLEADDLPLPLEYVYPSNTGDSHRAYVAQALGEMRKAGVPVLENLVQLVEHESRIEAPVPFAREVVGERALLSLARSGPVPRTAIQRIQEAVGREKSYLREYSGLVETITLEKPLAPNAAH